MAHPKRNWRKCPLCSAPEELADWQAAEGRLWLAGELVNAGAVDAAAEQLAAYRRPSLRKPGTSPRACAGYSRTSPLRSRCRRCFGHLALVAQDYPSALSAALALPEQNPAREELLAQLQERILGLSEPSAAARMTLAQAMPASMRDPLAGFEEATTASLLAPGNAAVQEAYSTWTSLAPADPNGTASARSRRRTCACTRRVRTARGGAPGDGGAGPARRRARCRRAGMARTAQAGAAEKLDAARLAAARLRWTRLYLKQVARAEQREELPELFSATTGQLPRGSAQPGA